MDVARAAARVNQTVPWPIVAVVVSGVAFGGFALLTRSTGAAPTHADEGSATVSSALSAGARTEENVEGAAAPQPAVSIAADVVRRGEAVYDSGNYEAALSQYQAALSANPNDPVALNNMGQVLVRLERPSEAIAYFDRAVALVPEAWAYHFNSARAYGLMQQWSQAIDGYRRAAALFPDDYATAFNLALALQANGNLSAALDAFQRAIKLAPGQADFHLAYGRALESTGRSVDAAAAYRRYLELEPTSRDAEKARGRIAHLEGVQSGS